jgi:hypothetical protein
MIPEPITIDGKSGTVVYLDNEWHPVSPEQATMAKVLFNDGTASFFFAEEPSKPEGIGGLTRKFDEAQHPRGEDGRFKEASQPRVFNRPSDVKSYESWGGGTRWGWVDPKTGETTGMLLTGEPIPREGIPPKLYHVTTNAPAVESSGVLLGQLGDTGLGGGQAQGVSFTASPEDAVVIQRELRRAVRVARGEDRIEDLDRYAREDEQEAGLPPHTLDDAVQFAKDQWGPNQQSIEHTFIWDKDLPEDKRGYVGPPPPPEEQERLRRSSMNDALKAYLQIRGKHDVEYPLLKNPLLFGRQEHLAKLKPEDVQILEASAEDIPLEALVTTGSDKFLHEVRVYADVPRRRKAARDYVREPAGTSEGGQFASTGTSGVSASDPVLAVQAKAGIAAVEKLLPEAIKTAEYSSGEPQDWDSVSEEGQEEAYHKYVENAYDDIEVDTSSLSMDIKDDLKKDNQKVLDEAVEDVERQLSYESFIDEFGAQRALPVEGERYTTTHEGEVQEYVYPAKVEEQFQLKRTLDIETLDYGYGDDEDGVVALDWDKLRFTNGQELNEDQKEIVRRAWDTAYEKAFEDKFQEELDSDSYMEKVSEMRDEAAREQWNNLDDDEKLQYFQNYVSGRYGGRNWQRQMREGEPKEWVTGVETGKHSDENYARTHAIALKLAELRTEQVLEERGLTGAKKKPEYEIREVTVDYDSGSKIEWHVFDKESGKLITGTDTEGGAEADAEEWARTEQLRGNIKTPQMISDVWDQWKRSSSDGLSMSVQLAAARELGGHHRMTPEEVIEAEAEAKPYGGIPVIQAYVRAQWETTQMVMDKAGADKIEVYRGLMLPGNMVNATTRVYLDEAGNKVTTSNITTGIDKVVSRPYVGFDFDGEHFVVHKERREPKSITEIAPETWHQVDDATKAKVKEQWDKDAADTLVDPEIAALDPERGKQIIDKLYQKLGDDGRFDLMHTYAAQGRITLPKFDLLPYETDEEAIERRLTNYLGSYSGNTYVRLPDLVLQRSGAQSTTGTPSVANSWGGVGGLPENPTRVVIRIEAPPTSVFSLPVYGQNSQEEHETVVLGTKDKWLWDAWQHRAPTFETHTITGAPMPKKPLEVEWPKPVDYDTEQALKAEKKPLVIDMQAEDRGKPHWMSTVDWAKVEETEK